MRNYFKHISNEIKERIKLISQEFSHSGMKGTSNEEIIKQFLTEYLPKRFAVGQGKIVDFAGQESKQTDIIIYDHLRSIPFYIDKHNLILPIESVFAVVEIKANLDKTRFEEALLNFTDLYNLDIPDTTSDLPFVVHNTKYYLKYPKTFILGLKKESSLSSLRLQHLYLDFVKQRKIRFPFLSFCGVLDEGHFINIYHDNQSRVSHQNSGDETLLYFLLNLVGMSEYVANSKIKYSFYLDYFNKDDHHYYRFNEIDEDSPERDNENE